MGSFDLQFHLVLKLFELILTGPSKELELLDLNGTDLPIFCNSRKSDGELCVGSNTASFVRSIAPFEADWRPSQGQKEALRC